MKKLILIIMGMLLISGCTALQRKQTPSSNIPPVTGISAEGGIKSVRLKWSPVSVENIHINGYIIYRSSSKGGPFEEIGRTKDAFSTEYLDNGGFLKHLGNSTTYFYKISAFNKQAVGTPSAAISATTQPPPAAVTDIYTKSGLPRMVVVQWKPPKDKSVAYYNIYRGSSKIGPFKKIGKNKGYLNTFFVDKGLKDQSVYYYSVSSVNYDGIESDIVASAKAVTKYKPQNARKISAQPIGAGAVLVQWWPSYTSDVTNYIIYRGTSLKSFSKIAKVTSDKLSYKDSSLNPGTTYYYKVDALDKDNIESSSKETASVTTYPIPDASKGISAKELEDGSVIIQWDKVQGDVVKYILFKRHFLILTEKVTETEDNSFIDKNVKNNTTYYYWVRSVDKYGQISGNSPVVSVKIR